MRAWWRVAAALALGACTPDIYAGAYFCGPALACPDEQACDRLTETCVEPADVEAFACAGDAAAFEPDDDAADAALVDLNCLNQAEVIEGCLADGGDLDVTHLRVPAACVGNAATFVLRTSLAFGAVEPTFADETGAPVPAATCPPPAASPPNLVTCVSVPAVPADLYVTLAIDADADCGGQCAFNRTALTVTVEP